MDEYAVSDDSGIAKFEDVLIGTNYTLEEIDTGIQYVVPETQKTAIEWNKVTNKSVHNVLKSSGLLLRSRILKLERHKAGLPLPEPPMGFIKEIL